MRALTQVEAALAPQLKAYVDRNPKSAVAFEQAKQSGIAGGTNRASIFYMPFPLTFVDGKGAKAITLDGQKSRISWVALRRDFSVTPLSP